MWKNLILSVLLIAVAVIHGQAQLPAETHDQAALQLSPGIRFLIDLSAGIESDKKRLQKLKKDSLILAPMFKSKFDSLFLKSIT